MFSKVDFAGQWKVWFAISSVLLVAGIAAIALGNLNFGIDFEGGTKFTVASPDRELSEGEVRQALPGFVARDAVIQTAGNGYEVRTPVLSEELAPFTLVVGAQLLAERVSILRGRDPDRPPGLTKVTRTH